ncbi:MAG: bifunctional DNA-formamidopyrimidine glycosylase/DNA-(apurinic or apyrimidinic site) lyase [Pirellulales bacterium]
MPELPEVETMRRGLDGCIGRRIAGVTKPRCRLKPIVISPALATMRRRLVGQRIVGTGRAGKRVLVHLDTEDSLVFEPRMTGIVLVAEPPNREHLRLGFQFGDQLSPEELMYWDRRGLGSVRLMNAEQRDAAFGSDKLGPDALAITAAQLKSNLQSSRREIKVALLDQRCVAGIGNLYAAEILHVAGIHPRRRCDQLNESQWKRLVDATRSVLRKAIRYEGSTLSDGTYRNALNKQGGYQNYHRVYDRVGKPCPQCGKKTIERIVQAQRATFFCTTCQPLRQRNGRLKSRLKI